MLRKNVVGTAVAEGGFVCNKNSSFRCRWDLLRSKIRLRLLTNGGRKTGRNCTAKGEKMKARGEAVVGLHGWGGEGRGK